MDLPINEVLADLTHSLKTNPTLILQAPPGAGKSTRVPLHLMKQPWLKNKKIIMLEPRRVAARVLATQMAKLLGEDLGQSVGYQVKMESCYTQQTKILVVTQAILVRKLQHDQSLDDVAMIIFDEFHERSIHSDLSLALSLQVQELLRDDLKILIMSATLNSQKISSLLGDVPIICSQGKIYDVEHIYLDLHTKQPDPRSLHPLVVQTILKALKENEGDILVFLPGVKEINHVQKLLLNTHVENSIVVLPLYSSLSKKEQDKALKSSNKTKVILSTNIAQTSLTIEGVGIVIDSGYEKQSRYNQTNAMDHLELCFISKDAATQRAGRAGRLSNGVCYKLWHQSKILQESSIPEILRADLSSFILELCLWGIQNINELSLLDIPKQAILNDTKEVLKELNMLDDSFKITPFGKKALRLGVHPRFSYMILKGNELGYPYEACLLASMLSEKDIFLNSTHESDLGSRFLHLYERDLDTAYIHSHRSKEVLMGADFFYKKLKTLTKITQNKEPINTQMLSVLLLFAYPDRLARQRHKNDNKYLLSNAKGAKLHTQDPLFNQEYLVVSNLNAHEKDSHIKLALSITTKELEDYFSHFIQSKESITYNKESQKFDVRTNKYFLKLLIESKPSPSLDPQTFKTLLLDLIQKEGLDLFTWSKKAKELQQRVCFLNHHSSYVDFTQKALLQKLELWCEPFLSGITTIKSLQNLDLHTMLLTLLSWEDQQRLDTLAPSHLKVPSGSKIPLDYSDPHKPSIRVKIQEVFGLLNTPKVLNNTLSLQIHLLSPAMRPIQITYDLQSFWNNSYNEVRKELRGKYKKHYWPENPLEAIATNKTKKHIQS